MITSKQLREITNNNPKKSYEDHVNELAKGILINLEEKLTAAAKNGEEKLFIYSTRDVMGLSYEALLKASKQMRDMGLTAYTDKGEDAEGSICTELWVKW